MDQLWVQILIALLLKEIAVGLYYAVKSEIDFRQWEKDLDLITKQLTKAKKKTKKK